MGAACRILHTSHLVPHCLSTSPTPAPKRQYRTKKAHDRGRCRGLSGVEIAQKRLKTREAAAGRERTAVTPEDDDIGQVLVPDTPPRPTEESQGGTSTTPAIRPLETPRRAPPPYSYYAPYPPSILGGVPSLRQPRPHSHG
jgi:hypothetical protein